MTLPAALLVALYCSGVASYNVESRRDLLQRVAGASVAAAVAALPAVGNAKATGPADGNLPDLPPEAVRSYLQYRVPLQTSADFYIFELYEKLSDPAEW